jgi:dTDP-4-dehydrorhamnose reductase
MVKYLVLGSRSRLAKELNKLLPSDTKYFDKSTCDITSKSSLESIFRNYTFTHVINCAAITDLKQCEADPKFCLDVNTLAVFNLSKMCNNYKKKLIHISSDYAVDPKNVYGISKYLCEKLVEPSNLIIRTNFYDNETYLVNSLLSGNTVNAYSNINFNPISINRLANEIIEHINDSGIINIFTKKELSYYNFAQLVCDTFGLQRKLVKETIFKNTFPPYRPLSSYVKPDIKVDIKTDLRLFKEYMQ